MHEGQGTSAALHFFEEKRDDSKPDHGRLCSRRDGAGRPSLDQRRSSAEVKLANIFFSGCGYSARR